MKLACVSGRQGKTDDETGEATIEVVELTSDAPLLKSGLKNWRLFSPSDGARQFLGWSPLKCNTLHNSKCGLKHTHPLHGERTVNGPALGPRGEPPLDDSPRLWPAVPLTVQREGTCKGVNVHF